MTMAIQPLVKLLNKVFKTKCLYKASGEMKRGPGVICWLYIIIILAMSFYEFAVPRPGLTKKQIRKHRIINFIVTLLSIIFMYHMCYICRGFIGFLILLLINVAMFFIHHF